MGGLGLSPQGRWEPWTTEQRGRGLTQCSQAPSGGCSGKDTGWEAEETLMV